MPLTYDKASDTFICSIHGDVGDNTGWVPCWAGCDEGWFDAYEDDPINNDPGDLEMCDACNGEGGWTVCGECAKDNPDVEW